MKELYKINLFYKNILVNDTEEKDEHAFEVIFSLASLFGIKVTENQEYATEDMIKVASHCLGRHVPEPFYRGFPETVRRLTREELLFDQLLHYAQTYGLNDFSNPGHSVFEENFQRAAFNEHYEEKPIVIMTLENAMKVLQESIEALLTSTRPLNSSQIELIANFVEDYDYTIQTCASKDTAIKLLVYSRDLYYAQFLRLSDVIKVVDWLNYSVYNNRSVKKLNLKNKDRRFIEELIDYMFDEQKVNIKECFEKKKLWTGLLHHIHYMPISEEGVEFVKAMRGKENHSAYSTFEALIENGQVVEAAKYIRKEKGSGSLIRHLDYLLSRASDQEVEDLLILIETKNPIILIQLLTHYSHQFLEERTFKFVKYEMLRVHRETNQEMMKRRSQIKDPTIIERIKEILLNNLKKIWHGQLGKVYVDESMKKIAIPLQEGASNSGYGTLPKGSRVTIPEGNTIRCFTYWEKVDDIDLSMIGLTSEGKQVEFSWRTMWDQQSDVLTFSGDETSGYNGGSEYFDVSSKFFDKAYPLVRYLIFCDNVYSYEVFDDCFVKAGFMLREAIDSGEIFEPKTVQTSFNVKGNSRFSYLFALDLKTREMVWLNVTGDSMNNIAGTSSLSFLHDYLDIVSLINVYKLAVYSASEVVDDPALADVIFSDQITGSDDQKVIHSYDQDLMLRLVNGRGSD